MYLVTTTILQFIFIFLCFLTRIAGYNQYNLLQNKFFIFIAFFFFQIVVNSLSYSKKKCSPNIKNIFNDSLFVALLSIIGYSIYIDLLTMKSTQYFIYPYLQSYHLSSLLSSTIIVSFIFIVKVFQIIFFGKEQCHENNYEFKY